MSTLTFLSSRPSVAQQRAEPGPTQTQAQILKRVPDSRFEASGMTGKMVSRAALSRLKSAATVPHQSLGQRPVPGRLSDRTPPPPPGGNTANPKNNVIAETAVSSWNEREWRHE